MNSHDEKDEDVGDVPDLARPGRQREAARDEAAVVGGVEGETRPDDGEQARGKEIVRSARSQELIRAADVLSAASDSELLDAGLTGLVAASYSYQWSGMLPAPDEFNKYDKQTRERICRWNDAFTTDESLRQDKLVANEIKQQETGM
ncbi:MAG: hypothetical protein Q4B54_14285, partial [Coriobacteriales bacterium]|nr:hypothetical protein [Coriobacteriales bacterium]